MKIELKKISINLRMSQETTMFIAELFIDGKHVARCRNDGHGGNTLIMSINAEGRFKIEECEKWIALRPEKHVVEHNFSYKETLESIVDDMIEQECIMKQIKPKMKKNLVFSDANNTIFTLGWKTHDINQLLNIEKGRLEIKKIIAQETAKGNKLLNTNIPNELLN